MRKRNLRIDINPLVWNKSTIMGNETFYFEWGQTRLKSLSVPLAVQLITGKMFKFLNQCFAGLRC